MMRMTVRSQECQEKMVSQGQLGSLICSVIQFCTPASLSQYVPKGQHSVHVSRPLEVTR